MKFNSKIISILSFGVISITPILTTTNCSCSDFELNLNDQKEYIYNRTFSLMGNNSSNYAFGTGWIISDCTKEDTTDYKYYVATNWHVTKLMNDISAYSFYYADNSLTSQKEYIEHSDYGVFPNGGFVIQDATKNFVYPNQPIGSHINAIDLNVVKVDFGNPSGSIKNKLDKLNNYQKENGFINKFVKDSNEIRSKNKIIGGYPKKGNSASFGGQWESHSFAASNLNYCEKYYKYDGTNLGHCIGEDTTYPYWDVSPQYMFKNTTNKNFMSGGASGSMMITQDYEVCGIYWGGWETTDGKFYPSFSLFNTDEVNFLEQYI